MDWPGSYYIGIASLCSVLKQKGHHVSLIHVIRPISKDDFIKRIKDEDPDLIGFSSTSHHFSFVRKYASCLVEAKIRVPTIYGGIHPTIVPQKSIQIDGIDMICRGEGEAALTELCLRMENKEDTKDILNLWIKKNGNITINGLRPVLKNLDQLPFPDRGIFNYESLSDEREGNAVFLASRGCPFSCTYCSNHALKNIYGKGANLVRFRSVDNVIDELRQVIDKYPSIKTINFHDDILFLKKKWSEEFAEKYRREIGLPFICNARPDITDERVVELYKRAGCSHVKLGLESGNETIRFDVLNRHMTDDHIIKAHSLCKKAGLKTVSFNMLGMPCETPRTILDTIKLNASLGVDFMQVSIYQPYPGTALRELCLEKKILGSEDLGPSFLSSTVLRLKNVSPSQILMFKNYFRLLRWWYRVLQNLPLKVSRISTLISDRILSSNLTSKLLNLLFIPLNFFHNFYKKARNKHYRINISDQPGNTG
jgi:anaerobic magnesium-protoporphyrin IX monomethyl ester cyclase